VLPRTLLACLGFTLATSAAMAQVPSQMPSRPLAPGPARVPTPGKVPAEPRGLPQAVQDAVVGGSPQGGGDATVTLPLPETRVPVEVSRLIVNRSAAGGWQVQAGPKVFGDYGPDMNAAEEARRVMRELVPTEWVALGTPRPSISYGLTLGQAAIGTPRPRYSLAVDLKTVRAAAVQGTWVVRDDAAILANFGTHKADAEQAAAVARRYGFNRVGFVGFPAPVLAYYYHDPKPADKATAAPTDALLQAAAEQTLTRTGVPIPGTTAFVGERVVIDPRKVEVRKERADYVLAHGPDVLARFTANEWAARDALKVIQDGRFTEFCTVGGATFFLVHGQAPTRVSFFVQTQAFDPHGVKVRATDGGHTLYDGTGRKLFVAPTAADADALVRVIQAYQFDTVCQTGTSPRASLKFLAKTGGR